MTGAAPDCRALVPRTPPDGLAEWARPRLPRHGLVYAAEWAVAQDLAFVLDELSPPRKIKMVRVKCSCCGDSALMDWGYDKKCGYGFVNTAENEGDWEKSVTADGDETVCPFCNTWVIVKKKAAIRNYTVISERSVMSAGLVNGNLLALTGWTVQRRLYKSGVALDKLIPAEAYVFGPSWCAQLMGCKNGYSGICGHFVQYERQWRQPRDWKERWGETDAIYGLTPELVAASCLPNCKLDVYMGGFPGTARCPVAYLRLYQTHPNVEHVLVHGLPRLLRDLIAREVGSHLWRDNRRGLMSLPEIDWTQRRPAKMLRLTTDELRMARAQDWDMWAWDLFVKAKATGETLTERDMVDAFHLGDERVAELAGYGAVAKSIRYLLRQCEWTEPEPEDEDPDPHGIPDVATLLDYWQMARGLGRNINDSSVRYPKHLLDAHDRMTDLMRAQKLDMRAVQFRLRRRLLRKYCFAADGLFVRPAASQRELKAEGDALHHCVSTYGERYAEGKTAIFFIRRASAPGESYYTLELNEQTLTVRQNRGKHNCPRTPEVQAFEDKWLDWVRSGAPRDKDGKPIVGQTAREWREKYEKTA